MAIPTVHTYAFIPLLITIGKSILSNLIANKGKGGIGGAVRGGIVGGLTGGAGGGIGSTAASGAASGGPSASSGGSAPSAATAPAASSSGAPGATAPIPSIGAASSIPSITGKPGSQGSWNANKFNPANQGNPAVTQPAKTSPIATIEPPAPQAESRPAATDYMHSLQQAGPQVSTYHPSFLRQLGGAGLNLLGGTYIGRNLGPDPGGRFVNAPINKQITDYQNTMARKGTAFQAETSLLGEQAKSSELGAQKQAEQARAAQESAHRQQIEFENSPAGFQQKKELEQIAHPGAARQKAWIPVRATLANDKEVTLLKDPNSTDPKKSLYDPISDTYIGYNALKPGTVPEENNEKSAATKVPSAEDQDLNSYAKSINKDPSKLTYQDRLKYYSDIAKAKQTPELGFQRSAGAQRSTSDTFNASYNRTMNAIDKDDDQYKDQANRISNAASLISQGTAEGDAIAIPALLQATIGGKGSNFRMTQAEINNAAGGRTLGESITATLNKLGSGQHPIIPPEQRGAMANILKSMADKVNKRVAVVQKYRGQMANESNTAADHRKIAEAYKSELDKLSQDESKTPDTSDVTPEQAAAELAKRRNQKQ